MGRAISARNLCCMLAAVLCSCAWAQQNPGSFRAELTIREDQPKGTINPEIYGHFAEHLGRCIYDGIWVGENSPIPNTRGIRSDIIAALKKVNIPRGGESRAIRSS